VAGFIAEILEWHRKMNWKKNSDIFEIGWLHQPKNSNFTLNFGAVAACGKQRGAAGKVSLMWKF